MKYKLLFIFSLSMLVFQACDKQDSTVSKDPIILTTDQKQIVASSNSFGLEIFKQVATIAETGENVFVSPLSISLALSMLYNGAARTTKDELTQGLGYVGLSDEQVNIANRDLIKALMKADPKVVMEIANSIWYKNDFEVKQSFLATNKDYLNADVRSASFDQSTIGLINSWVSDKTHKKIESIIDEIPDNVVMYLINAIYFKGIWQYKFDKAKTQKLDFTLSSGNKKQVDFMIQEGSFEYFQNNLLEAVNLPYGDGNFSMMVLLPNEGKTYKDILAAMNGQNWATWNNSLGKANKKIYLPKFKFAYKKLLNNDLSALGMPIMFTDNADLSGINSEADLYVSKVLHKTYVDVNEEGTEAAAVTAVEIGVTSVGPDALTFKADIPFIFVIREKESNALLFMGILNEPVIEN